MNKVYFFADEHNDEGRGVFVGAKTWKEGRRFAISTDELDGVDFIDIKGHVCKENGKVMVTDVSGIMEGHEVLATGYTGFWWSGNCEECGAWKERLNPIDGKLICYECEAVEVKEVL